MKKLFVSIFFVVLFYSSCAQEKNNRIQQNLQPISVNEKDVHKAYFASGCFWCVEAIYESLIGVKEVTSGYSGGDSTLR